jgi:hypothetical protein
MFLDVVFLPRLRTALPRITSVAWLRATAVTLAGVSLVLAWVATWSTLDWWTHGHLFRNEQHGAWLVFLAVGCVAYAQAVWPRSWLTARIDGLRARAKATEDSPAWTDYRKGN